MVVDVVVKKNCFVVGHVIPVTLHVIVSIVGYGPSLQLFKGPSNVQNSLANIKQDPLV